jgi:DNA-binding MltR family transcriptional regulator
LVDLDPKEHAQHLLKEEGRSFIILHAATVEGVIEHQLRQAFDHLGASEIDTLLGADGPLHSFANKTRIAFAIKLIDFETRQRIDLIRMARNAAAHSLKPLSFATDEIVRVTVEISPEDVRELVRKLPEDSLKETFGLICTCLLGCIAGTRQMSDISDMIRRRAAADGIVS